MDKKEANRLIISSILVTGIVSVGRQTIGEKKLPKARILVGILFSGFLLSVMAQFAPELAGPLAMLLMVTAVFASGNLIDKIAKISA